MKQYRDLLQHILDNGIRKTDRTGTGTISTFGYQMRFDLKKGFPLLTTKKTHLRSIIYELLWFLNGDTNIKYLNDNGVSIWDEWADEDGELGPIYGYQWRSWYTEKLVPTTLKDPITKEPTFVRADHKIDQIKEVIEQIKTNPDSRRLVVSAWNVGELEDMALQPCHVMFQFNCRPLSYERRKQLFLKKVLFYDTEGGQPSEQDFDNMEIPKYALDCQLYQRSADTFLGVPFNIASYSLLTMMIAQVCNMVPGEFIHTIGDAHIYTNHLEQVKELLSREDFPLPTMILNPDIKSIDDFKYEDFTLMNYRYHPAIKAPVAV